MNTTRWFMLASMTFAAALQAQPTAAAACNNQTLQGSFGVQISGSRPAPSVLPTFGLYLPGAVEQVIGVVIETFDGNGGFTQTDNVKGSLSGITFDRPGGGTYTVNPDCTGTFTLNNTGIPFPIVNRMVVVDGGKEFLSVVVSPQGVFVSSRGRKMN
jgi:hypothetical protein